MKKLNLSSQIKLESCTCCPVCGSLEFMQMYGGLEDGVFNFVSKSDMQHCNICNSAFLNPRITEDTIGFAYSNYYTHVEKKNRANKSILYKIWNLVLNDYVNLKYNIGYDSFIFRVGFILYFFPKIRRVIDRDYRGLSKSKRLSILDVGCGDGTFLELAQNAGHEVMGVDPDIKALHNARRKNLNVTQGDIFSISNLEYYDAIFLSHVIEHVHYPEKVVSQAYKLLKPNGYIWIETPNIESFGNRYFSKFWRGLEPPRHLVIFNWGSIENLLVNIGFQKIVRSPYRYNFYSLGLKSNKISVALGSMPRIYGYRLKLLSLITFIRVSLNFRKSEFITLKAFK